METIIHKERIPSLNPKLKRHIEHDPRSRSFGFDTKGLTVVSVTHKRYISILDQGSVGSCTGNAGVGTLGSDPIYPKLPTDPYYSLNQQGAVKLYSDAAVIDGSGPYPPNDFGSTGLSIAKALKKANLIGAYQHTFSLNGALKALSIYPILVGMNWYNGMFKPARDGKVSITGPLMGGHEVMAREIDAKKSIVWFDNSWGSSWGVNGRFYLTFKDFETLLKRQGDVIVLLPKDISIPTPVVNVKTTNKEDEAIAIAMRAWLKSKNL